MRFVINVVVPAPPVQLTPTSAGNAVAQGHAHGHSRDLHLRIGGPSATER